MKNILYIIGVIITIASCSKEKSILPIEKYADVSFSVGVDNQTFGTKATSSMPKNCDIRYIIEARRIGDDSLSYRGIETSKDMTKSVDLKFRLIEGAYNFLIWADYVEVNGQGDKHYDTDSEDGLMAVTIINPSYTANDDSRDCFAARVVDKQIEGDFNLGSLSIKRPMAKLVFKDSNTTTLVLNPTLNVEFTTTIPSGYNVLEDKVLTTRTITPNYPSIADAEIVGFDYLFVADSVLHDITITVDGNAKSISDVLMERNKTTNIITEFK